MLSRTLLSLGVAAAAASVPSREASTAPAPTGGRHALRGATNRSSPERETEKHDEQQQQGFNSWLQEYLPPGDTDQYVYKWTGTWSDVTAPQESMYSGGSQGYSQYVDKYKSMAGKHPSAGGSWQDKMAEQRTAYGNAVGQDFPGNAYNHWQEGSTSEASSAAHNKSQSTMSSERDVKHPRAKVASELADSGASTALLQVTPPRGEAAVKPTAKEAVGGPAANEVVSTHSHRDAVAQAADAPRRGAEATTEHAAKNDSNHSHQEVSAASQKEEDRTEEEQNEQKEQKEQKERKEERREESKPTRAKKAAPTADDQEAAAHASGTPPRGEETASKPAAEPTSGLSQQEAAASPQAEAVLAPQSLPPPQSRRTPFVALLVGAACFALATKALAGWRASMTTRAEQVRPLLMDC